MPIEGLERRLADHPFFAGLPRTDIDLITGCAMNVRFPAETYMFREGDPSDRFYLLRTGRVAVEIASPATGAIIIRTVGPGDILVFSWLFPPYRMQFDGRTLDDVHAFAFDAVCLRNKCDEDPRLGYELMKRFSQVLLDQLQATRLQVLDVYGRAHAR